jgi:hypothetical protein
MRIFLKEIIAELEEKYGIGTTLQEQRHDTVTKIKAKA